MLKFLQKLNNKKFYLLIGGMILVLILALYLNDLSLTDLIETLK